MKRILALVLALAIAVPGCGHSGGVRVADPDWPGEILMELNADAAGKRVDIETLDGEELQGIHLRASSDSTVWYAPNDSGHRTAMLTSRIAMVHVRSRHQVSRAKQGFIVGAALGALPVVAGVMTQPETAVIGCFVGLLGAGVGGAIGAYLGHLLKHEADYTVTYVLNGPPPTPEHE